MKKVPSNLVTIKKSNLEFNEKVPPILWLSFVIMAHPRGVFYLQMLRKIKGLNSFSIGANKTSSIYRNTRINLPWNAHDNSRIICPIIYDAPILGWGSKQLLFQMQLLQYGYSFPSHKFHQWKTNISGLTYSHWEPQFYQNPVILTIWVHQKLNCSQLLWVPNAIFSLSVTWGFDFQELSFSTTKKHIKGQNIIKKG